MQDHPATRLETDDLGEIVSVVAGIYCAHSIEPARGARAGAAGFEVMRDGPQPIVQLRYGRPVRVDAGSFPRLLLMQTCLDGSGSVEQGSLKAELRRGQTMPLSPSVTTRLAFDGRFAQQSVRLEIERIEALCSKWLNRAALDRPLRFALAPFSAALEQAWGQAVGLIVGYARSGIPLPASAIANLDEFLVSLVLSQSRLPHDAEFVAITRAIVAMSRELDMQVVAEGVETPEQSECLRLIGCDELQGYLFSHPLSAIRISELLARGSIPELR